MSDESSDFHIWSGVFKEFDDVPSSGRGFQDRRWIERSRSQLTDLLERIERSSTVPPEPWYPFSELPILTALIKGRRAETKILDFGGGVGVTYVRLRACMEEMGNISYHIVDPSSVREAGAEELMDDPRVHFHEGLPEEPETFDVIHLESSLQYVDDWRGLLEKLCGMGPSYVLLVDLLAGDIPTFVTAQKYYDSIIPVRFYNFDEIVTHLAEQGYELCYRSQSKREMLGEIQSPPLGNLPDKNRLDGAMNALFVPV